MRLLHGNPGGSPRPLDHPRRGLKLLDMPGVSFANDINDRGWIVGVGFRPEDGFVGFGRPLLLMPR